MFFVQNWFTSLLPRFFFYVNTFHSTSTGIKNLISNQLNKKFLNSNIISHFFDWTKILHENCLHFLLLLRSFKFSLLDLDISQKLIVSSVDKIVEISVLCEWSVSFDCLVDVLHIGICKTSPSYRQTRRRRLRAAAHLKTVCESESSASHSLHDSQFTVAQKKI